MTNSRASRNILSAVASVDQSVNNSTTLVNSTYLTIPMQINKTYSGVAYIYHNDSVAGDFKYDFSLPSGATGIKSDGALVSDNATAVLDITTDSNINGSATETLTVIPFYIKMSSTSGNLIFRFAQNVQDVSNATVKRGSSIIMAQS